MNKIQTTRAWLSPRQQIDNKIDSVIRVSLEHAQHAQQSYHTTPRILFPFHDICPWRGCIDRTTRDFFFLLFLFNTMMVLTIHCGMFCLVLPLFNTPVFLLPWDIDIWVRFRSKTAVGFFLFRVLLHRLSNHPFCWCFLWMGAGRLDISHRVVRTCTKESYLLLRNFFFASVPALVYCSSMYEFTEEDRIFLFRRVHSTPSCCLFLFGCATRMWARLGALCASLLVDGCAFLLPRAFLSAFSLIFCFSRCTCTWLVDL